MTDFELETLDWRMTAKHCCKRSITDMELILCVSVICPLINCNAGRKFHLPSVHRPRCGHYSIAMHPISLLHLCHETWSPPLIMPSLGLYHGFTITVNGVISFDHAQWFPAIAVICLAWRQTNHGDSRKSLSMVVNIGAFGERFSV